MKNLKILLICAACFYSKLCISQNVELSGLYISFGSGDILGYGVGAGMTKDLGKKPRLGLGQLLVGGEMLFETGTKEPKIENTTANDIAYNEPFFRHVSGNTLWAKAVYHPFHKFLKGFYVGVGPTIGYWKRSREKSAGIRSNEGEPSVRLSVLDFDNGVTIGYRLSGGIDFRVLRKMYIGGRMDFSNNQKAEINSTLGLRLGYRMN
jgi:hypothetical protein